MRGDPVDELADEAFRYAEDMIAVRNKLPEGGIAAIHKPKRKYERKT
jgi:hypothetical protein